MLSLGPESVSSLPAFVPTVFFARRNLHCSFFFFFLRFYLFIHIHERQREREREREAETYAEGEADGAHCGI